MFDEVISIVYNVAVSVNNENFGTAEFDGTPTIGQTIALTATPETGYRFVNWTVVSGGVSLINPNDATNCTFVMLAGNASVSANFDYTVEDKTVTLTWKKPTDAGALAFGGVGTTFTIQENGDLKAVLGVFTFIKK